MWIRCWLIWKPLALRWLSNICRKEEGKVAFVRCFISCNLCWTRQSSCLPQRHPLVFDFLEIVGYNSSNWQDLRKTDWDQRNMASSANGNVIVIEDDSQFQQQINQAGNRLVVVDFTASWWDFRFKYVVNIW